MELVIDFRDFFSKLKSDERLDVIDTLVDTYVALELARESSGAYVAFVENKASYVNS